MNSYSDSNISIQALNENSVLIQFQQKESSDTGAEPADNIQTISLFCEKIKQQMLSAICDCIPSYTSIVIVFDFLKYSHTEILEKLLDIYRTLQTEKIYTNHKLKTIRIPVYYSLESGPDIERVCSLKNISMAELIRTHSETTYNIYAIGFAPGFPYLGYTDKSIATPRLSSPRAKVASGSVGIANNQTGIYPQESPGGWNIIGRTPIAIIDLQSPESYQPLKVGDQIKFDVIDKYQFDELLGQKL